MSKPELGTKCACAECHERFYDLNRAPAVCPKCGAQQPPPKARVIRPSRSSIGAGANPRRVPVAASTDDEAEAVDTPEADGGDDAPEPDEEADDDIEIDPARVETAD